MSTVFDPAELHEVVRDVVGTPPDELVPRLARELEARYPGHVRWTGEWIFSNAGGAMGTMTILHASLTEYLIVFGTPIGTSGHSGRFRADDYFYILEGEQWAYAEGERRRRVYKPGDLHHLARGSVEGYRIPEAGWALEYARGWIPLMLPFGVADVFTSTLDWRSLGRTLRLYAGCVFRELRQGKV